MYEPEENAQNENESKDGSLADRIANMLRTPRINDDPNNDFLNRRYALRVDPQTGNAYRTWLAPTGTDQTPGASSSASAAAQPLAYVPPTQTRDAKGKTVPKYRMGIGQRILASVANFANGFAGNGATPVYVGPGALNNRYYQDEAFRQQQNDENPTLQGAGDRYRNTIDWRTIGKDPVSKKWYGKTYGGQRQEIGTPPWAAGEEDEDPNNNDGAELPPMGTQVEAGPGSARRRFADARKRNSYR